MRYKVRKRVFLFFLVFVMLLGVTNTYALDEYKLEEIKYNDLNTEINTKTFGVLKDNHYNTIFSIVQESKGKLIKIDKNNKVMWEIETKSLFPNEDDKYSYVKDFTLDEDNNIYAIIETFNEDKRFFWGKICKINSDGKILKTININDNLTDNTTIDRIIIHNNYIYFKTSTRNLKSGDTFNTVISDDYNILYRTDKNLNNVLSLKYGNRNFSYTAGGYGLSPELWSLAHGNIVFDTFSNVYVDGLGYEKKISKGSVVAKINNSHRLAKEYELNVSNEIGAISSIEILDNEKLIVSSPYGSNINTSNNSSKKTYLLNTKNNSYSNISNNSFYFIKKYNDLLLMDEKIYNLDFSENEKYSPLPVGKEDITNIIEHNDKVYISVNNKGKTIGYAFSKRNNYSIKTKKDLKLEYNVDDSTKVLEDTPVTFKVLNNNKRIKEINIIDSYNNKIELSKNDNGEYTFTMPSSNITIIPTYEELVFEITKAKIEGNNTGDEKTSIIHDEISVDTSALLYDKDDYIKYKISIKNNDKESYYIEDVFDDNKSKYFKYEYDPSKEEIKPGEQKDIYITLKYLDLIPNDISLLDDNNTYSEENNTKISVLLRKKTNIINPLTNTNSICLIIALLLIGCFIWKLINEKHHKKMLALTLLVLSIVYGISLVNADTVFQMDIDFSNNINVKINFLDENWKNNQFDDFSKIVMTSKINEDGIDVSEKKDGSIKAWVEKEVLYIGSRHNIYAPIFSYQLFSSNNGDTSTRNSMSNITNIDFNNKLYTNYVTNIDSLFANDIKLEKMDLNDLNVTNASYLGNLFNNCESLEEININNWVLGEATALGGNTIVNTKKLKKLSMRNWNMPQNVKHFISRSWGGNSSALEEIDVSGWDLSKTKSITGLFADSIKLKRIIGLETWDTSNVEEMSQLFQNCESLKTIDVEKFDTSNVKDMNSMFNNCPNLEKINLNSFNTSKIQNVTTMFAGDSNLKTVNLDNWDLSKLTNSYSLGGMFSSCNKIEEISMKNWKLPESFNHAIGCRSTNLCTEKLNSIDVSGWDLKKTKNLAGVFGNLYAKDIKGLNTWDTSTIEIFDSAFDGSKNLEKLDLSSWDTSNAISTNNMFYNLANLKTIYVSDKFKLDKVTRSDNMFGLTVNIKGQNGTLYDDGHLDKEYARIDKVNQPGYFSTKN